MQAVCSVSVLATSYYCKFHLLESLDRNKILCLDSVLFCTQTDNRVMGSDGGPLA